MAKFEVIRKRLTAGEFRDDASDKGESGKDDDGPPQLLVER